MVVPPVARPRKRHVGSTRLMLASTEAERCASTTGSGDVEERLALPQRLRDAPMRAGPSARTWATGWPRSSTKPADDTRAQRRQLVRAGLHHAVAVRGAVERSAANDRRRRRRQPIPSGTFSAWPIFELDGRLVLRVVRDNVLAQLVSECVSGEPPQTFHSEGQGFRRPGPRVLSADVDTEDPLFVIDIGADGTSEGGGANLFVPLYQGSWRLQGN